jgi:vacuolar-type H+-ATPase subunit I/STV1
MSTSTATTRSVSLPSARALVGIVYGVCVLGLIAVFVGEILFTDRDPYRSEGPVESIIGVGVVGTTALIIAVGLSLWLVRTAERAKVGAALLGAMSVLSLVVFWSGAPGVFGACAAWLAGLTRGGRPLGGAARVAGIVGVFVALLNIVLTVGGVLLSGVAGWDS